MLSWINQVLTGFMARFQSEKGQALAEYGLILALIAVVCVFALTALGLAISGLLSGLAGSF